MVEGGKSKSKKSKVSKREEKEKGADTDKASSDVKITIDVESEEKKKEDVQAGGSSTLTTAIEVERTQADQRVQAQQEQLLKNSNEISLNLVEVRSEDRRVLIGPARLTRFEKARIVGARALQLSLGAPPLIQVPEDAVDPISIAEYELNSKALPISIRRILPDGHYQDIPIVWLMN
ncbi:MAG: DNA-directed RNA polymerase subunit K [Candidatus Nitrosocaldus sp.]